MKAVKGIKGHKALSHAEETLALIFRLYRVPAPRREYQFHAVRKWRFDFAWPEFHTAIEVEGMTWKTTGRHQRPEGYAKDCEKYNQAAIHGWRVLRYTPALIAELKPLNDLSSLNVFPWTWEGAADIARSIRENGPTDARDADHPTTS